MKIKFKKSQKEFFINRTKEESEKWYNEKYCLEAVERNGYALKYVKKQSKTICLKAVENCGDALKYVEEQSETICLKAVENCGDALKYVEEQSEFLEVQY